MKLTRYRFESGLLLFEVLLAVTIFSLAAVSLAVALSETLDAFREIRRESEVRIQLQTALAETTGQRINIGKETLQLGDGSVVYSREITALERENQFREPVLGLYQVLIRADWQEGTRRRDREVLQYVYQAP